MFAFMRGRRWSIAVCMGVLAFCTSPAPAEEAASADPELAAARTLLDEPVPAGLAKADEIKRLVAQDRAARMLGDAGRRLIILRRLVELAQGTPDAVVYESFLWREEWRSGNQAKAFEIGRDLLARDDSASLGLRLDVSAQLVGDYLIVGNPAEARASLETAQSLLKAYRQLPNAPYRERNTAIVGQAEAQYLMYEGRYADAEKTLLQAERDIDAAIGRSMVAHEADTALSTHQSNLSFDRSIYGTHVRLLADVGRHVEAEAVAREGLNRSVRFGVHGAPLGEWHESICSARLARRDFAGALSEADSALALYLAGGLGPSARNIVTARELRLEALMGLHRWSDALAEYDTLVTGTADDPVARATITSSLIGAVLEAKTGQGDPALEAAQRSLRYRERIFGSSNPRTVEARAVYAMALMAQGRRGAAIDAYHDVCKVIFGDETRYVDTLARGLRGFILPLALEDILALAADDARAGRHNDDLVSDAFVAADRLRDSRVQQAMIDSAARALVDGNPALSAALREEEEASNQLRTAYEVFIKSDTALGAAKKEYARLRDEKKDADAARAQVGQIEAAIETARRNIDTASAAQVQARAALARDFPDYHRLVNPRPARPREVQARLGPKEAFISVYATAETTYLFALRHDGPVLVRTGPGLTVLGPDVHALRDSVSVAGRSRPPNYAYEAAYRLYQGLAAPLADVLAAAPEWTVAEGGVLGQIPWAILVTAPGPYDGQVPWLVRSAAVTQTAGAAAWVASRDRTPAAGTQAFIGFGAPDFGPLPLAPLPETRAELATFATALKADPERDVFTGPRATRAQVLAAPLASVRVIAFATHGLKPGDLPNLSQPALALSVDASAGAHPSAQYLLTLDDVLRLKLGADLVVLSACNTGSDDGLSEEAVSGLGRGFFFAGAHTLLLTHWEVESQSAGVLVAGFVAHLADGGSKSNALRLAQLSLIDGTAGEAYRHPFFWGAYAVTGDTRS